MKIKNGSFIFFRGLSGQTKSLESGCGALKDQLQLIVRLDKLQVEVAPSYDSYCPFGGGLSNGQYLLSCVAKGMAPLADQQTKGAFVKFPQLGPQSILTVAF